MNVKKVKRMCSVKGCGKTDSWALSKIGEWGGVIICEDCLNSAVSAIKSGGGVGTSKAVDDKAAPLFFHPETAQAMRAPKGEGEIFECPECGKVCKNQGGLNIHMKSHAPKGEDEATNEGADDGNE